MPVTVDDLWVAAGQLSDAVDAYDRFVDGWPYEQAQVPAEVASHLARQDADGFDSPTEAGAALAADIEDRYYRARELEAAYVQQTRARGRTDWERIVAETEPVWQSAQRVLAAGYGIDPETGDPGYLLPPALCPAHRVSMNAGTSPVVYEHRVAQYRAVADRFAISPTVVYHPGSGHDVSPSAAFPDSQVVYSDVEAAAMADLCQAGYDAHGADAAGYEVDGGADVIVFRNAGLFEEAVVAANLRPGGWVLANDHLESARHISRMPALELVAVVPAEWPGDSPEVNTVGSPFRLRSRGSEPTEQRHDSSRATATAVASDVPDAIENGSPLDLYVFRHEG